MGDMHSMEDNEINNHPPSPPVLPDATSSVSAEESTSCFEAEEKDTVEETRSVMLEDDSPSQHVQPQEATDAHPLLIEKVEGQTEVQKSMGDLPEQDAASLAESASLAELSIHATTQEPVSPAVDRPFEVCCCLLRSTMMACCLIRGNRLGRV